MPGMSFRDSTADGMRLRASPAIPSSLMSGSTPGAALGMVTPSCIRNTHHIRLQPSIARFIDRMASGRARSVSEKKNQESGTPVATAFGVLPRASSSCSEPCQTRAASGQRQSPSPSDVAAKRVNSAGVAQGGRSQTPPA